MSVDLSLLKADQSALIAALTAAGGIIRGKTVRCPFHDDSTPPGSGSVYERDGKWGYRCHAASCGFHGDCIDVEAKSRGVSVEDLLKEKAGRRPASGGQSPAPSTPTATKAAGERKPIASLEELIERAKSWVNYKLEGKTAVDRVEEVNQYTCPDTKNADLVTIRIRLANGDKTFVQGHQSPDTGKFYFGRGDGLLPLFNRSRLKDATIVLVVEGEKAVRRVTSLGIPLVATTSPGGAGADKASLCDWSPLAGRTVYLWPDRDDPDKSGRRGGEEHMKAVAKILEGHECDVYWIDPYKLGLTDHGDDVCDYLDSRRGTDPGLLIDDVLMAAMPMPGPAEPLRSRLEDCISGKYATAPWPWRQITAESQALRPGTVTLICGDPGATKSFWLIESLLWWTINGIPASVYELEEDSGYWLHRCLAIQSECGQMTQPEWCRENPEEVRALFNGNRKLMDELARRITSSPDEAPTYKTLLDWIESRARRGDRIIGVDPLTGVSVTADRYLEDLDFMAKAKKITRDYGCSLVLITHPKKSGKTHAPMDDMAGGAAFPRFAQTVLWIKTHKPPASAMVRVSGGRGSCIHNRSVIVAKARNAAGGGAEIAFDFHGDTLRFEEKGLVLDDDGKPDV